MNGSTSVLSNIRKISAVILAIRTNAESLNLFSVDVSILKLYHRIPVPCSLTA